MKSGKQRRAELDARKKVRADKAARQVKKAPVGKRVPVNPDALAPNNSYGPDYVLRGYYEDVPFECVDCSHAEVWTAAQQKWWYEVAKGSVYAFARRCRGCRRRERERRSEAKRVHLEGLARKRSARKGLE